MWKLLFDIAYVLSCFIPNKNRRDYFRNKTMFGYKSKLNTLYKHIPELKRQHIRLAKGGGALVFIFNNKTVYKISKRKEKIIDEHIINEKRITDALRPFCKVQISQLEIIKLDEYIYCKQSFIPGKMLVKLPLRKIVKNMDKLTSQLANIIHDVYTADPQEIRDLKNTKEKYGWVNTDMCSNILINPKTMQITGIIDWEWTFYADVKQAFKGLYRVSHKMTRSGIGPETEKKYHELEGKDIFTD